MNRGRRWLVVLGRARKHWPLRVTVIAAVGAIVSGFFGLRDAVQGVVATVMIAAVLAWFAGLADRKAAERLAALEEYTSSMAEAERKRKDARYRRFGIRND